MTLAGQKLLGKTLDEMGSDFATLYKKGRDQIIEKATKKVKNLNDGNIPNLRVARDVFWNGSFSAEAICAEYFGGVLAASRSDDGKDDNGVHYVDVIKSLSSKQLELHYIIYNSLNKLLIEKSRTINVGQGTELQQEAVFFSALELENLLKLRIDTDLNILYNLGLLSEYKTDNLSLEKDKFLPYVMVRPTTFGILLYAIAHNRIEDWQEFSKSNFGDFEDIKLPKFFASSIDELVKKYKTF